MIKSTAHIYRQAYSGLSRGTWLLSIIMLINRSGTMVVPFLTLYLTSAEMGYNLGQAGLVFGLFGLGAFFGAWIGGWLTDKIGFYPVQLITLLSGGSMFLVLGQMKTYFLISLCTFLLSFFNEAFRPANSSAIAFYSKEANRTRSYALNRLAVNLGWAVGSTLGGFLAPISYELLFWVDGFTNIGAAIIMWIFLKPIDYKVDKTALAAIPVKLSAYKDKHFIVFIILTTLFASCFFQLFTNLPVFFRNNLGFTEPMIGAINAINGIIIAIVEMALIYKLEGRRQNLSYIKMGVLLFSLSLSFLILPGAGVFLAFLVIILVTMGEILAMPFMNSFWISRTSSYNRGQYAALYTMAWSIAQTLGPILGSQIAFRFGFFTLWLSIGALGITIAWLFHRLQQRINLAKA